MAHQNEIRGTSCDAGAPIVEDSTGTATGTATHEAGFPAAVGALI